MRVPLPGLLFILLVVPLVLGQQNSQHITPNSPKGFDKQYKNAFNAYEKAFRKTSEFEEIFPETDLLEKVSGVYKKAFRKRSASNQTASKGSAEDPMKRFRTFAIPEHWFTDAFGPNQGPELAREYQDLFRGFQSATEHEFYTLALRDGGGAYPETWVETKVWTTSTELKSARSAPTSLVPLPPVQRFRTSYRAYLPYTADDCRPTGTIDCTAPEVLALGYENSRVDTFIYVDGAFRFIGGGPCPFWATPCSPNLPL